jgi:hypothetical protein
MRPIDIGDIVEKLLDLRTYSPELSKRMDHEKELPEDEPIPFLIERIEASFAACEGVTAENKSNAFSELTAWLIISYQFYLMRLAREDNPWMFTFPKSELHTHH